MDDGRLLFAPFSVGPLRLRNRIVMSPMLTCYATRSGEVTDRMCAYYAERARGDVGLVAVEYATVVPRSNNYLHHLGAGDDRFIPGLRRLVRAVHEGGAPVALQLGRAGRRASARISGVQAVAPSALAGLGSDMLCELSVPEIEGEGRVARAAGDTDGARTLRPRASGRQRPAPHRRESSSSAATASSSSSASRGTGDSWSRMLPRDARAKPGEEVSL